MKVYSTDGRVGNADKDQIPIMLEAGWSLTKPKPEAKKASKVKEVPKESPKMEEVLPDKEPEAPVKVKKIRRVLPK